jgi:hypothetical protein
LAAQMLETEAGRLADWALPLLAQLLLVQLASQPRPVARWS